MVPVKKNEIYNVEITGITHEGQGVGRIDNFTVFVDGAIEKEEVEIKIIKLYKSYGVGKLLKILKPSYDRIEPFCEVYKRCGGCSLQHMSKEAGLKFKENLVRENLKRIGKLEDIEVCDIISMEEPFRYRNKAQYPVRMAKGETQVGFYAKRSHDIIEGSTCEIQHKVSDRIKAIVKDFIVKNNVSVYDETTGKGLMRHVVTRVGFKTGEVMVVLVLNGKAIPEKGRLIDDLLSEVPEIKSIIINVNKEKTNVILGRKNIVIYRQDSITDYIDRFKFNISPRSFFQVNPFQTEALYNKVLEYAALSGEDTVFDLYCGIGTISLFLSQKAKKVYGVEVVKEAIEDAKENARINGVGNVEFITGEAEKVLPDMGVKADVVVLDPPRKGCDESLLETLVEIKPSKVVYVSCNPATLARDLKYLSEKGFKVDRVQPVDMFPWTAHVECVVLMSKK
ncbi:23S rRNA (uracil(1939)-C(5))-methyltransferase RlmD [Herbivorax sp. ANBcel31]|uniref:23S rRNA (uracil(1939)-C(5))-methyltransferase RlmD n=1 Tax=Herbivorax sp. ANBcel31 TaxID=3069754 RepID=UPI0027B24D70|nr:23S rRNA (uracil(1939)-C(5))-methyltransferase RlmD [Herbivorax sp. ANBcel31]MDQ2085547.1 23S rRNA (uracil(1939)-C(5))-methyltransferase RlmD [Herbivorax sp. ANBcel31]